MRIGLLGGTFNPVHLGHLKLAEESIKALNLDKLILIPANITPLRVKDEIISSNDRYEMLKLAVEGYDKLEVSRVEIDRNGISYTIDTVMALSKQVKEDTDFFFIIGSDLLSELKKWKDFDEIRKLAAFIVVRRPDFPVSKDEKNIPILDINALDISSAEIRKKIKNNRNYDDLVPPKVYSYILKKRLYINT